MDAGTSEAMVGGVPASPATELRELPTTERAIGTVRPPARIGPTVGHRVPDLELRASLISAAGALLCLASVAALLLAGSPTLLAAGLFSLGVACDLADGIVARRAARRASPEAGKIIDSIADKIGEIPVWLGLLAIVRNEPAVFALAAGAFALGMLTSFLKAFAEAGRLELDWSEARVFGRAGRAVLLGATLWLAALPALVRPESVLFAGFAALLAFNFATLVRRSQQLFDALKLSSRRSFT